MPKLVDPGRKYAIVDKLFIASQRMKRWMQDVTGLTELAEGTTSPEGIIEGSLGANFLDTRAKVFYRKTVAGGTTGWVALNSSE